MHDSFTRLGVRTVLVIALMASLAVAGPATGAVAAEGDAAAESNDVDAHPYAEACAKRPVWDSWLRPIGSYYYGCAEADAEGERKSVCYYDIRDRTYSDERPDAQEEYCASADT